MGIQLDWQVESERKQRRATEDPEAKRWRRRQRRKLIYTTVALATVVCGVIGAIVWRLNSVDAAYRRDLEDTVDVEIRALKLGDEDNYMSIRRSSSDYWLETQRQTFQEYQVLKRSGQLELTGNILDLEMDIDESRARVLLEERIDGVSYEVVWFYWYYTDEDEQTGWRRVPPDVAFWGDEEHIDRENLRVNYHELDATYAETLANRLSVWWGESCVWLSCMSPSVQLTIEIVPEAPAPPRWDDENEWKLLVSSPLHSGRVRRDATLDSQTEQQIAILLADRAVHFSISPSFAFNPIPYSDAVWMVDELERWLIGRYLNVPEQGSLFIESLVSAYGEALPGLLVRSLTPDAQIEILQFVTGSTIPDMGLDRLNQTDWRSFFEWRLELEYDVLSDDTLGENRIIFHNALYDSNDSSALSTASTVRDQFSFEQPTWTVNSVIFSFDAFGSLQASIEATTDPSDPLRSQMMLFRWVDETFKRVN